MPRNYRTSRAVVTARVGLSTWMVVFLGSLILGIVPGIGVLFLVIAVVAVMMFLIGLFVRVGGWLLYSGDPDYCQWISEGGDPYFDMLPPPFNRDSIAVRAGGLPEPITDFVPPSDWLYQCTNCGARNPSLNSVCWHCSAGGPQPREYRCGGCGGSVREKTFGDLERTGVICPWCGTVTTS